MRNVAIAKRPIGPRLARFHRCPDDIDRKIDRIASETTGFCSRLTCLRCCYPRYFCRFTNESGQQAGVIMDKFLTTNAVSRDQRLEYWTDLICDSYVNLSCSRTGDGEFD